MKLTKTTLKQIIKEELSKALNEELPQLSMKDKDAWIAKQREKRKRGMKPAAGDSALAAMWDEAEEDSAPMSTADGRSIDANEAGQSMESYDSMTPNQARRAINAALKAGEIDKDEWRRLRRKYHKRRSRRNSVNRDALDKMGAKEDPRLKTPTPQKIATRKGYLPKTSEFEKSVDASTRRGRKPGADPRTEELYKKQLERAKRAEKYAAWKRSQSDGQ